ncbi:MAG TPA: hypothetical protein VFC16_05515 [Nakamurella sp.]|nr:hypothetical protein [Nakamurella sp.]
MTHTTTALAGREVTIIDVGGSSWEIRLGNVVRDAIVAQAERLAIGYGVSAARVAVELTEYVGFLVAYQEGRYSGGSIWGDGGWPVWQALEEVQALLDSDELGQQAEIIAQRLAARQRGA